MNDFCGNITDVKIFRLCEDSFFKIDKYPNQSRVKSSKRWKINEKMFKNSQNMLSFFTLDDEMIVFS
jgi:hypothetical protein